MRNALLVCGLALAASVFAFGGCNGDLGSGGAGGSGGAASGPNGATNGATSGNASTGNASTGNASTGNATTGNAGSTGATSGAGSTSGVTSGGGDMEPANMNGMTAAHNAARAAVSPPANPAIPPLAWSSTVATYAQTYSQSCNFAHSMGPYGENIYATTGSSTPQNVVASWVSEAPNYNYANNTCSGICGHYTQVVWRDTTSLGCGVTNCSGNSPFNNGGPGNWQFWVCDYDPPGNFNGMKPY